MESIFTYIAFFIGLAGLDTQHVTMLSKNRVDELAVHISCAVELQHGEGRIQLTGKHNVLKNCSELEEQACSSATHKKAPWLSRTHLRQHQPQD